MISLLIYYFILVIEAIWAGGKGYFMEHDGALQNFLQKFEAYNIHKDD